MGVEVRRSLLYHEEIDCLGLEVQNMKYRNVEDEVEQFQTQGQLFRNDARDNPILSKKCKGLPPPTPYFLFSLFPLLFPLNFTTWYLSRGQYPVFSFGYVTF